MDEMTTARRRRAAMIGGGQPPIFVSVVGQTGAIGSAGTTLVYTVPAAGIAVQHTVVVAFGIAQIIGSITIADSRSNTWNTDLDTSNPSGTRGVIFSTRLTTALQSGDTITVTFPSNSGGRCLGVLDLANVVANGKDATAGASGNSTTPTSGATGTRTKNDELGLSVCGSTDDRNFLSNPPVTAGWSVLQGSGLPANQLATSGDHATEVECSLMGAYRTWNATGTDVPTFTMRFSSQWHAQTVTYKAQ